MKRFARPEEIKCGVIGYGGAFNMGKAHLNEMKRAGMVPTAVAEIDPERLKVAQQEFPGIETYASVAEMLKRSAVNLLAIITPHNTHAKLAVQCLKAGRHVVTEKPFAITTAECDAMIAAAKKSGCVLSTYHNRHWDGCILNAVKLVRSGVIGQVFRVEAHMGGYGKPGDWWRSSKGISGGILYDWGVHLLEYSLQILQGAELAEVAGFNHTGFWADKVKWGKDTNEDEGFAIARFKGGQWLTLTLSSIDSNPKRGWLEATGTLGSLVMDWQTCEVTTHEDGTTVVKKYRNPE
ncbi:MAG: Gfo/Idh/MocA family oxidoreductase, partial [Planctomycetes bacterium]|nr:Gfo/Idh/MocA family oxidoreductase [Planctomycetota bacterium]